MSNVTLSVKFKCQPGTRDTVKTIWEKETKSHAQESDTVLFSCYSFAQDDPDTIILFEVLADSSVLTSLYQETWFKQYLGELSSYLAAPPEIIVGDLVWIKN